MFERLKIKDKLIVDKIQVNPKTDCWEWQGRRNERGYGVVRRRKIRNSPLNVHRYIWTLIRGEIPKTLIVCHRCDNPCCCNPNHLFLGTVQDNSNDMIIKGRHNNGNQKGENNGGAKLTEEKVKKIKEKLNKGIYQTEIAKEYGVSNSTIHLIAKGKIWNKL